MKKGFTLIELLVVVLIIGILSAVALPQYQKTVNRSRATEAWIIAKAVGDAQNRYRMENGSYAYNLEDLDIEIPEMKNWEVDNLSLAGAYFAINFSPKFPISNFKNYYISYYDGVMNGVTCLADTKECLPLLPCLGIGSASGDGASCSF